MLDALGELNQSTLERFGDPETRTRIAQYEMAFRMQTSVPELIDLKAKRGRRSTPTDRTSKSPGPSPPVACSRGG